MCAVRPLLVSAGLLLLTLPSFSQRTRWLDKRKQIISGDTVFYFYKAFRYGVQDLYNPAYLIANGGFDIMQAQGYEHELQGLKWRLSFRNINDNLLHPVSTIRFAGWKYFLTQEIFPLNFTPDGSQWIPNYFLHMLGSGMEFRMMTEWYRYHRGPVPKLFSAITVFTMHYLNEVVENDDKEGPNSDPIADFYVFDIAGVFLFNSIPVSRFFSQKLHMADWSLMPALSFPDISVRNPGQYFIYKWEIPRNRKWAIFMRWGMGTQGGVTYKVKNENAVTASAGVRSGKLSFVDKERNILTSTVTWTTFFAWDKNNTPLVTVQICGNEDYTVLANVYPGVIKLGKFSPGIWALAGVDGTVAFGICARYTLGLGIGYNRE